MKSKKIVVTGIGVVAPPGIGSEEFWKGLLSCKTGLDSISLEIFGDEYSNSFLHKIHNFKIESLEIEESDRSYIEAWKESKIDRDLGLMLAAALEALIDGKVDSKDKKSMSLIVSHENPCLEQLLSEVYEQAYFLKKKKDIDKSAYFRELFNKSVRTGYETQTFMLLFHIAKVLKIKNYSLYVNNACASGLYAIEAASDIIKLGKAKKVLVVAGDSPGVFKAEWFRRLGMYSEDGKIKPFDDDAKGFVLGEGGAAILLEDYDSALDRGVKIYAEYCGGGFLQEGWKVSVPNITTDTLERVIKQALYIADVQSKSIDLICSHGVGTKISDSYEIRNISSSSFDFGRTCITALKPYFGHNLGGSSLLEVVTLLLMLDNSTLLPILNSTKFNRSPSLNFLINKQKKSINNFMKICTAFAGYNAAVVFKKI